MMMSSSSWNVKKGSVAEVVIRKERNDSLLRVSTAGCSHESFERRVERVRRVRRVGRIRLE